MLRGKKNFLVQLPGPTGEVWNFVELLVELFWSLQVVFKKTSRDRPKSAPHLRLKNSKRTSICQSIGEFGTFYEKKLKQVSQCQNKLKWRTLWDFATSILSQNSKKMKGDPLVEKKFWEKVAQCLKNLEGDPLVSSGFVCYAGNLFGSVHWANRYNLASSQNFVEILVERFWSLQEVFKKMKQKDTDEKPWLQSTLFRKSAD